MSANKDVGNVNRIANKIAFTSMTGVELIDELAKLAKTYPNDGTFGAIMRSIIYNTHTNLKS